MAFTMETNSKGHCFLFKLKKYYNTIRGTFYSRTHLTTFLLYTSVNIMFFWRSSYTGEAFQMRLKKYNVFISTWHKQAPGIPLD